MASSELTYRGQQAAAADGAHGPAESKPRTRQQLPQPLRYVLGEQRLVFSLVGMALATLVFLLLSPSTTTTTSSSSSVAHLAAVGLVSRQYQSGGAGRMAFEEAHHAGNPNFEMIRHDVVEPILLEVDQIYHLACPASPVHYKFNPVKTIKTNVVGTLNMLGLAKRVGARFLLTSTSEVYGDPLQHPQVETYWGNVNPIGVRSCYDEGKRTAETLTMDYHRGANLEVRIARIFNTYGPRMCIDDGRVVSNFVAQALRKEPLTVYGDGKQTRSFQYVSDLVEGLMKLMEGEHVGPFNLGNPGEFTMLELAKVVQDTIDPNARIEFRANTADDPHKRKPDITKAKELLGWEPKVALRNGLPLMVQDFRTRIFGDQKQQQPDGSE
ncbi:unnamed protein product [Triticum turgidum subsp. durum]|uniref:UDP-glucuronic acid decarboxylase 1 n=1 Tax=Triticum turgidum subsp. durum TaxID=4567 RepID=A0A9R1RIA6_TRITD|nr:unnamed protein product [Triticum turgidum subsp. durum]